MISSSTSRTCEVRSKTATLLIYTFAIVFIRLICQRFGNTKKGQSFDTNGVKKVSVATSKPLQVSLVTHLQTTCNPSFRLKIGS